MAHKNSPAASKNQFFFFSQTVTHAHQTPARLRANHSENTTIIYVLDTRPIPIIEV